MNSTQKNPDNSNIDIIKFSSQLLEQELVFNFWREGIKPLFLCEIKEDHDVEHIHQKLGRIDQIIVSKGGFSSQLFVRDRKHLLRNDHSDHILMQWYVKGSCHACNGGRDFVQSPEHIVLMDLGYECLSSTISPSSEVISIAIPRELLQEFWGPVGNLAGLSLPVNSTKGSLLKSFMISLCEEMDTIKVTDASAVAEATMQMVSSLFQSEFKQTDASKEIVETQLRSLINDFIIANLRNPRLGTDMLLEKFHCSRATLYRLFQIDGGVASYINRLRLKRCYKYLISSKVKKSQISELAESWGFSNRQQFNRQFRQHFGVLPSNVVFQCVNNLTCKLNYHSDQELDFYKMASWIKTLGSVAKS